MTAYVFRVTVNTHVAIDPAVVADRLRAAIFEGDESGPAAMRYLRRRGSRMTNTPAADAVTVEVIR